MNLRTQIHDSLDHIPALGQYLAHFPFPILVFVVDEANESSCC